MTTPQPPRPHRRRRAVWLVAVVCLPAAAIAGVAGCGDSASRSRGVQIPGANPDRGAELIGSYGCGSCHTVAGVHGADGEVGPPLTDFGKRTYIAGELVNGPDNLERWIQDPQAVEPGTAMPDLGVTAPDARDIAAYLLRQR